MFGVQVLVVLSVAMVTGGSVLHNFAAANNLEQVRFAEQEHLWAASTAAVIVPIGAMLLLTAFSLLFIRIRDSKNESSVRV